jgi:hypothetical protein
MSNRRIVPCDLSTDIYFFPERYPCDIVMKYLMCYDGSIDDFNKLVFVDRHLQLHDHKDGCVLEEYRDHLLDNIMNEVLSMC